MAVTPRGIVTPDLGSDYQPVVDLGIMANSIDTALNSAYAMYVRTADQSVFVGDAIGYNALSFASTGASSYLSLSGGRFTCVRPGVYDFEWLTTVNASGSPQGIGINRNSTPVARQFNGAWTSSWNTYGRNTLIALDAGDTVWVSPVLGAVNVVGAQTNRFGWKLVSL